MIKKYLKVEWPVRELNPDLPKTKVNKKIFYLYSHWFFPRWEGGFGRSQNFQDQRFMVLLVAPRCKNQAYLGRQCLGNISWTKLKLYEKTYICWLACKMRIASISRFKVFLCFMLTMEFEFLRQDARTRLLQAGCEGKWKRLEDQAVLHHRGISKGQIWGLKTCLNDGILASHTVWNERPAITGTRTCRSSSWSTSWGRSRRPRSSQTDQVL